jgi:alkanesulfonate monooxygenase SsuD/methylene tetrahydromethanopterin reductase-like flavin-dependent oxidoreductase (luciferase family)
LPLRRRVIGDPGTVRSEIEHVVELYGAEEVIVVTITHDHRARVHSYELLAEAFGLSGADDGTDPVARGVEVPR